ncbi:MAG: hypothetical protein ACTSPD_15045 [Promethearchaeota archaeon]
MLYNNRVNKTKNFKILLIVLIIINVLIPLLFFSSYFNSKIVNNKKDDSNSINSPKTSSFSKEDYSPLINQEKHGLGNISLANITFNEEGFVLFEKYGDLTDDLIQKGLNITYNTTEFITTKKFARVFTLNTSKSDRNYITVRLNDTITVEYNMSKDISNGKMEGYLAYGLRLYPTAIKELKIKENGSNNVITVNEGNYTIDNKNVLVFYYNNFFNKIESNKFVIYLIYDYNLTISNWELFQYNENKDDLTIREKVQTITPKFNYKFTIVGKKYDVYRTDPAIEANNLDINIIVNLPDKELLGQHILKLNGEKIKESKINDYLNPNGALNLTLPANNSIIYVNFTANFTLKFENAVEKSWAIDRLINYNDIRERIYFPAIISGPKEIYVRYLRMFESTIGFSQVKKNSSLYGRSIAYFDANVTEFEEDQKESLVFTENATKKKGLEIILPYMIKGEICPFSIKYKVSHDLRIIITDNINMPLIGVEVKVFYYGIIYGSYISKENVQPIYPLYTDENGEIYIKDVPNGNYTVKIYQDNKMIIETSVSAYAEVNYIKTNVLHFPLWILIFGTINGTIVIIGLIIYFKNKKR